MESIAIAANMTQRVRNQVERKAYKFGPVNPYVTNFVSKTRSSISQFTFS